MNRMLPVLSNESNWIPVRAKATVPGSNRTCRAHNHANHSADYRVQHGPIRREPRDDVAAENAVNDAISRRNRKWLTGSRLPYWWEEADYVKNCIGNQSWDDTGQNPNHYCEHTSTDVSRLSIVHIFLSKAHVSEHE